MMNIAAIIAVVLQIYALMMLWIALQTLRRRKPGKGAAHAPSFSVIVPFRDEAENLSGLLNQVEGSGALEWIFVDDGSTDGGSEIVKASAQKRRDVSVIAANGEGKKAALATGAATAKAEVILTLDADVLLPDAWFSYFRDCLSRQPSTIWLFPLLIQQPKSFFQRFEALDVLSLTAATQAFAKAGTPLMANGAALAVRRDFYLKALPQLQVDVASGDDVFLVHYASERKKIVHVADDNEAVVEVKPQVTPRDFLKQRIRWGSKARHYKGILAPLVAWLVLLTNLFYLALIVMAVIRFHPFFLTLIAFKLVVDVFALFPTALRFQKTGLLWMVIPASLLYPLYIVVTGVGGFFYRPDWKGRPI